MGCHKCDYTGKAREYDETAGPGWVEIPCPHCHGVDGDEPDWVTEGHDALTQEDIEAADLDPFLSLASEEMSFEEDMAWAQHGPAW